MQAQQSILVVDDTPENLRLLSNVLTEHGYKARSAPSGKLALNTIQKELPDLILLDIMMPGMGGFEVCRQLKESEYSRLIPVIFISALDEVFDKVTAFSVGGVDYISKPFQLEEVLARVRTHLSLVGMRQQLEAQNLQLQAQNQELDAFAHTVAHDLKNPLAKIITTLGMIESYATNLDDDLQELLQMGVNAGQKMNSIIDELLLLASVRKEMVPAGPVDMAQIVGQTLDRLSLLVEEYRPELLLPDSWPQAQGYAPWLEEVWANYLSNGMKYGGRPPRLQLGATPQPGGQIRFWVRDNGPGISPEAQASLFGEFTRLEGMRVGSHGLGLSIARRIITKLRGEVGVNSPPNAALDGEPDSGSEFYFTLPE
jgi:signal transduction histidine kinase